MLLQGLETNDTCVNAFVRLIWMRSHYKTTQGFNWHDRNATI